jgi:hypothetical protein
MCRKCANTNNTLHLPDTRRRFSGDNIDGHKSCANSGHVQEYWWSAERRNVEDFQNSVDESKSSLVSWYDQSYSFPSTESRQSEAPGYSIYGISLFVVTRALHLYLALLPSFRSQISRSALTWSFGRNNITYQTCLLSIGHFCSITLKGCAWS